MFINYSIIFYFVSTFWIRFGSTKCEYKDCRKLDKEPEISVYHCCGLSTESLLEKFVLTPEDEKYYSIDFKERALGLEGIHLVFEGIFYSNYIIKDGWFESKYSIKVLRLRTCNAFRIAAGAFASPTFGNVVELEITDVPISVLSTGVFNGLSKLKTLTLSDLNLKAVSDIFLKPCPNLEEVFIYHSIRSPIDLTFFSGEFVFKYLKTVQFENNEILDKIVYDTFYGLINVYALFLSENGITTIGSNAFSTVQSTLNYLDLTKNLLKTLPNDFYDLFDIENFSIDLSENNWNCDCELERLRQTSIKFGPKFESPVYCDNILIADYPNLCVEDTKTTEISVSTTESSSLSPPKNELMSWQSNQHHRNRITIMCVLSPTFEIPIQITKSKSRFVVSQQTNEEYYVNIEKFTMEHFIVGLEEQLSSNGIISQKPYCITNNRVQGNGEPQFMLKLQQNKLYRFCMMRKGVSSISPLGCSSFYSSAVPDPSNVWICLADRPKTIILLVVFGFLSTLFGTGLAYVLTKLCDASIIHSKLKLRPKLEFRPKLHQSSRSQSIRYTRRTLDDCDKQTLTYNNQSYEADYDGGAYITFSKTSKPPALPPRNANQSNCENKSTKNIYNCCNSDKCECYCDIMPQ